MIRIQNLDDLKKWISNPTEEKPIVLEWFMDWFFEELIFKNKITEAVEAYNVMIEFTQICEKMNYEDAVQRNLTNLNYWVGYGSTRWYKNYQKFLKQIKK